MFSICKFILFLNSQSDCYLLFIAPFKSKQETSKMSGRGAEKKDIPNIFPTSPCLMARKPPVEDIDYSNLSDDDDTSEDDKSCICIEELRSRAKETKDDLKSALGLEGSFREGDTLMQRIMDRE